MSRLISKIGIPYEVGGPYPHQPDFMVYHFGEQNQLFANSSPLEKPVFVDYLSEENRGSRMAAVNSVNEVEGWVMTSPAIRAAELFAGLGVVRSLDLYPSSIVVRGGNLADHRKRVRQIVIEAAGFYEPVFKEISPSAQERKANLTRQLQSR